VTPTHGTSDISCPTLISFQVIANLQMMMSDSSVAVHKRVIQAMTHLYKVALSWLSKAKVITDDMEAVWNVICSIKEIITSLLEADNDGIRTHTVKFMEMLVLTQTHAQNVPGYHNPAGQQSQFSLNDVPLTLKVSFRGIFDRV
jgi:symplekin